MVKPPKQVPAITSRKVARGWMKMDEPERTRTDLIQSPETVENAIGLKRWRLHKSQKPPHGSWHIWALLAGRGFGKTRAGTEWVLELAKAARTRIALVGPTIDAAQAVTTRPPNG